MRTIGPEARQARQAEQQRYEQSPTKCEVCDRHLSFAQNLKGYRTCSGICRNQLRARAATGRKNPHKSKAYLPAAALWAGKAIPLKVEANCTFTW